MILSAKPDIPGSRAANIHIRGVHYRKTKEVPLCQRIELINPKRIIVQKCMAFARECQQKTAVRFSPAAAQRAEKKSLHNVSADKKLIF